MSGFFGGGGATRASLALDTTDSPQFAGVNVGHASDTTVTRSAAGKIAVGGVDAILATGLQSMMGKSAVIEAFTAGDTLTTAESGKVCTNTGASGSLTLTLPAATGSGVCFIGYCTVAQNIVFDAAGSDVIQNNASASSAGGTATAGAVGRGIMLVDVASGVWGVAYTIGAWTMA